MNSKLSAAIGFAKRTGKCVCGEFACEKALAAHTMQLLILDEGSSLATTERWLMHCLRARVPCRVVFGAANAAGCPGKKTIAVLDKGFAEMILGAI